ncbi:MAG: hypothetical protein ABR575_11965 [Actinomycetota bacterium]
MRLSGARVLLTSLAVGLGLGVTGGIVFALLARKVVFHGVGTGLFLAGLFALALGLLGATEPSDGWRTGASERRSLAARTARDEGAGDEVSGVDLVVWGVIVGGGLVALSMVAFHLAAR